MKRRTESGSAAASAASDSGEIDLGGKFSQALRFIFIPHKVHRNDSKLEKMRKLCSLGTSFEELILNWVEPQVPARASTEKVASPVERPGYSITISRNDEMPIKSIGVIFERGEDCFGLACVAVDQAVSLYGAHERLNESTFSLSDSDGFTCDQEWFDRRNLRLGIVENQLRGGHIVPPSSIGELVLEYSLSTAGFVRFAAAERSEDGDGEIELTLVFLGKDMTRGWHEEMIVEVESLKRHVQAGRTTDTPTLLI